MENCDGKKTSKSSRKVFSLQALLNSKFEQKQKEEETATEVSKISAVEANGVVSNSNLNEIQEEGKSDEVSGRSKGDGLGQIQAQRGTVPIEEPKQDLEGELNSETSWVPTEGPMPTFLDGTHESNPSQQQELLSHLFPEGFGVVPPSPRPPNGEGVGPNPSTVGLGPLPLPPEIRTSPPLPPQSNAREEAMIKQLEEELRTLKVELRQARKETLQATQMAEEAKHKAADAEAEKTALEEKLQAKAAKCTQLDTDLQEEREKCKKSSEKNFNFHAQISKFEDEIYSLKNSLKSSEAKCQQFEEICATKHSQVSHLTRSNEALKQEKDQLKNTNTEKQDRIQSLMAQLKKLEYDGNHWKKQAADAEHRLAYLQNSLHRKEMQRKDGSSCQVMAPKPQDFYGPGPSDTGNFNLRHPSAPDPPPPMQQFVPKPPKDSAKNDIFPVGSNLDSRPFDAKGTMQSWDNPMIQPRPPIPQAAPKDSVKNDIFPVGSNWASSHVKEKQHPWETRMAPQQKNNFSQISFGAEEDGKDPERVRPPVSSSRQPGHSLQALLQSENITPRDYGQPHSMTVQGDHGANQQVSLRSLADLGIDQLGNARWSANEASDPNPHRKEPRSLRDVTASFSGPHEAESGAGGGKGLSLSELLNKNKGQPVVGNTFNNNPPAHTVPFATDFSGNNMDKRMQLEKQLLDMNLEKEQLESQHTKIQRKRVKSIQDRQQIQELTTKLNDLNFHVNSIKSSLRNFPSG